MATMTNAFPWGIKGKDGKWTFYKNGETEVSYNIALFQAAMVDGCGFCGKMPLEGPFLYNDTMEKGFCNQACFRASTGICICKNEAVNKLYMILTDEGVTISEYIVPVVLCRSCTHDAKTNSNFTEGLYNAYCKEAKLKGVEPPAQKNFRIEFRPMEL